VKNKAYRAFPLGQDAGAYLRQNRGRLLPNTYKTYESCLDKLARYFADLELRDFEPPLGTERLEEFVDEHWGEKASRNRAKNISILKGFFEWAVLSGRMYGDPARPIRPPKKRGVHRETFSSDQKAQILAAGPDPDSLHRDRCGLRLLLIYALRKESLRRIQFSHFEAGEKFVTEHRGQPMGVHGLHKWWYRCLQRAGIVAEGVTHGRKMHMARHTAGQSVLDRTGNLKAVQKLLGHSSITTTGDIYTDWDIDQLEETMRYVVGDDAADGDL
jgi:site-specific recombinase XerC